MEKIFRWLFHILQMLWENINDLHNLLKNQPLQIKLIMEHSFKELPFITNKMPKPSQISTTNPQTPNNTSTSIVTTPKTA